VINRSGVRQAAPPDGPVTISGSYGNLPAATSTLTASSASHGQSGITASYKGASGSAVLNVN
jgi:hypothetical protein